MGAEGKAFVMGLLRGDENQPLPPSGKALTPEGRAQRTKPDRAASPKDLTHT